MIADENSLIIPLKIEEEIKKYIIKDKKNKIIVFGPIGCGKTITFKKLSKNGEDSNGYKYKDIDYSKLENENATLETLENIRTFIQSNDKIILFIHDYFAPNKDMQDNYVKKLLDLLKPKGKNKKGDDISNNKQLKNLFDNDNYCILNQNDLFFTDDKANDLINKILNNKEIDGEHKKIILKHSKIKNNYIPYLIKKYTEEISKKESPQERNSYIEEIISKHEQREKFALMLGINVVGIESSLTFIDLGTKIFEKLKISDALVSTLGLGVPFLMILFNTYKLYKDSKEGSSNETYYDIMLKGCSYWKELEKNNPIEQQIIAYYLDCKNSLNPNESFNYLNKLFYSEQNIKNLKDEIDLLKASNKELINFIQKNEEELNRIKINLDSKFEEIDKNIEEIKKEIEKIKDKLVIQDQKIEDNKELTLTAGATKIENKENSKDIYQDKKTLESQFKDTAIPEYIEGQEYIINDILNKASSKLVIVNGEPGSGKSILLYQIAKAISNKYKKVFYINEFDRFSFVKFSESNENNYAVLDNINIEEIQKIKAINGNPDIKRIILTTRKEYLKDKLDEFKKKDFICIYDYKPDEIFIRNLASKLLDKEKYYNIEILRKEELLDKIVKNSNGIALYVTEAIKLLKQNYFSADSINNIPSGIKDLVIKILKDEIERNPYLIYIYYLVSHYPDFPKDLLNSVKKEFSDLFKKEPIYLQEEKRSYYLHAWYADITDEIFDEKNKEYNNIRDNINYIKNADLSEIETLAKDIIGNIEIKKPLLDFLDNIKNGADVKDLSDFIMLNGIKDYVYSKKEKDSKYGYNIITNKNSVGSIYKYIDLIQCILPTSDQSQLNNRPILALTILLLTRLFKKNNEFRYISENIFKENPDEFDFKSAVNGYIKIKDYSIKYEILFLIKSIILIYKSYMPDKKDLIKKSNDISLDYYNKAVYNFFMLDFNESIKDINLALSEKDDAFYNLTKGFFLSLLGKYDESLEAYDEAIRLDPDDAKAYFYKGFALGKLENYEESIECFDKAIELDPDDAKAYGNKGSLLVILEKLDEAIECFDKAIELDPDDAKAYYYIGFALGKLENYEESIEYFDKAIELDRDDAKAYYYIGFALVKLERYKESIEYFDKAIKLDPDYADAHFYKGFALLILERDEESLECFDKAIELDPDDADAHYEKAVALANLERYDEAIKDLDKAIELEPNNEEFISFKNQISNTK